MEYDIQRPCFWRSFGLFAGFENAHLAELAKVVVPKNWAANEIIFQRGDPGNCLYILTDGQVKLTLTTLQGREFLLRHLTAGDMFGELAILDGEDRSTTATAIIDTKGIMIKQSDFLDVLRGNDSAWRSSVTYLCRTIRATNERLEDIAMYSIVHRLARYYLSLIRDLNDDILPEHGVLHLSLNQSDIANILGASRPKVNRAIVALEDAGAIKRALGQIEFNTSRLREYSEPLEALR